MIRKTKPGFFLGLISTLVITMSVAALAANVQTQKAAANAHANQQPLYGDYKGVRIGMVAEEVRAKLGKPALASDEQDYYIVSQTETVQIAYDASHRALAISVDFIDGVGAPDFKSVVGPDVTVNPDGSMHKLINYDSLGFWVSYSRTVGAVTTVTITIQKMIVNR